MGLLIDGTWQDRWYDTKKTKGAFVRDSARFRNWITADGSSGFKWAITLRRRNSLCSSKRSKVSTFAKGVRTFTGTTSLGDIHEQRTWK